MPNKSIRSFEEQTIVLSGAIRDGGDDVTIMLSVEGTDMPSLPPLGIETTLADTGRKPDRCRRSAPREIYAV